MKTTLKYIDLAELIGEGAEYSNTTSFALGVECALRWLDEHPEAAPGRTITNSQVMTKLKGKAPAYRNGFADALEVTETRIVPDPEPTNAEKLQKLLNAHWWNSHGSLAEFLDDHGVTAPGGDDSE